MRISGENVHLRNISREMSPAVDFLRFMQTRLGCRKYSPVPELEEAFAHYGHIEIYACPIVLRLLDDPHLARIFIQNQIDGLSFEDNVRDAFSDHRIRVLIHQDGPLCLLSERRFQGQVRSFSGDFDRTGRKAILEVVAAESGRDETRTSRPPTLDDQEANTADSDQAQDILTKMLLGYNRPKLDEEDDRLSVIDCLPEDLPEEPEK
jgi:hypothetical protein